MMVVFVLSWTHDPFDISKNDEGGDIRNGNEQEEEEQDNEFVTEKPSSGCSDEFSLILDNEATVSLPVADSCPELIGMKKDDEKPSRYLRIRRMDRNVGANTIKSAFEVSEMMSRICKGTMMVDRRSQKIQGVKGSRVGRLCYLRVDRSYRSAVDDWENDMLCPEIWIDMCICMR
jgi:hypothetical protein